MYSCIALQWKLVPVRSPHFFRECCFSVGLALVFFFLSCRYPSSVDGSESSRDDCRRGRHGVTRPRQDLALPKSENNKVVFEFQIPIHPVIHPPWARERGVTNETWLRSRVGVPGFVSLWRHEGMRPSRSCFPRMGMRLQRLLPAIFD